MGTPTVDGRLSVPRFRQIGWRQTIDGDLHNPRFACAAGNPSGRTTFSIMGVCVYMVTTNREVRSRAHADARCPATPVKL
ncbi:MAG: hypothetical protein D6723_18495 [Acidobacteria bacterium]|nr:MAG: hypothetical protein D6723_18495 [Acidobacteriota bacterium]